MVQDERNWRQRIGKEVSNFPSRSVRKKWHRTVGRLGVCKEK